MNAEIKREIRFTAGSDVDAGVEEEAAYRTVSVLAIVSLVLGFAAPLCLVAPLLFAIPLLGIILALAAIARVASSDGAMIGRGAALIGLALCVASVCGAFARTAVADRMLSQQAREVALQWVALLQAGGGEQAFALTVAHAQGPPPKPPVNMPDHDEAEHEDPLAHFLHEPIVAYLMGEGRTAQVQFDQDLVSAYESTGVFRIAQLYNVAGTNGTHNKPVSTLRLTLQRTRSNKLAPVRWLISSFDGDGLPNGSGA